MQGAPGIHTVCALNRVNMYTYLIIYATSVPYCRDHQRLDSPQQRQLPHQVQSEQHTSSKCCFTARLIVQLRLCIKLTLQHLCHMQASGLYHFQVEVVSRESFCHLQTQFAVSECMHDTCTAHTANSTPLCPSLKQCFVI